MTAKMFLRRAGTVVTILTVASMVTVSAQAETYSLDANMRLQIGDGLPIPIQISLAPPEGSIDEVLGATVEQTGVTDPLAIMIPAGALNYADAGRNIPVFNSNGELFQVHMNIDVSFPFVAATLEAGGRVGAQNVSWCPGDGPVTGVPSTWDPGCLDPSEGIAGGGFAGILKYNGTLSQFGGATSSNTTGIANIALVDGGITPGVCNNGSGNGTACIVQFALATPVANTGVNTWGATANDPGVAPANGRLNVSAVSSGAAKGFIIATGGLATGAGATNAAISFFGPWTTGQITMIAPGAKGGAETFVITGYDNRVGGVGTIQLVGASISNRDKTGTNANRGWLKMTMSEQSAVPSLSMPGMISLIGLMALSVGFAKRRKTGRS